MALNGVADTLYLPLRYGGHLSAAVWIATASWQATRALRAVGLLLALDLGLYSFVAPWVSIVALYPSLLLLVLWFVLVGRYIADAGEHPAGATGTHVDRAPAVLPHVIEDAHTGCAFATRLTVSVDDSQTSGCVGTTTYAVAHNLAQFPCILLADARATEFGFARP